MINGYKILNSAKYFPSGIFQNYLVFIPSKKCIRYFNSTTRIYSWTFKGMSEESIENLTKLDSLFAPTFVHRYILPEVNFNEHYLINKKFLFVKKY